MINGVVEADEISSTFGAGAEVADEDRVVGGMMSK